MNRLLIATLLAFAAHAGLVFFAVPFSSVRLGATPQRHRVQVNLGYRMPVQKQENLDVSHTKINDIVVQKEKSKRVQALPIKKLQELPRDLLSEEQEKKKLPGKNERFDAKDDSLVAKQIHESAIVEARPMYLQNPKPRYPIAAKRRGMQGTVILEVLVDVKGKTREIHVLVSSGYPLLDKEALRTVKKWLFAVGRRGGEKTAMWVKVPIRFQLQ